MSEFALVSVFVFVLVLVLVLGAFTFEFLAASLSRKAWVNTALASLV